MSDQIMFSRNKVPLKEGDVVYTKAGKLPCKFILHAVGPTWRDVRSFLILVKNPIYSKLPPKSSYLSIDSFIRCYIG